MLYLTFIFIILTIMGGMFGVVIGNICYNTPTNADIYDRLHRFFVLPMFGFILLSSLHSHLHDKTTGFIALTATAFVVLAAMGFTYAKGYFKKQLPASVDKGNSES